MRLFNLKTSTLLAAGSILFFASCSKDSETVYQPYTVPSTYNFSNVEYSEAASRVSMWVGLTGYLGKATGRQLNQDTANYLWNNTNAAYTAEIASNIPYTYDALNALTTDIAEKTADNATIKTYIDSMVKVSESVGAIGSQGVPGKIGNRIFNYSGLEYNQLVAKGLMGAFQMNQVIYYLDQVPSSDNNTVVPGQGTAMQHNWDLAFGYVGIPKTYDTGYVYSTAPVKADRPFAIGGYFKERGSYIQAGAKVFEAFLKGRAAIAAGDYVTRNASIATIKEYLEKTLAAAAYAYAGIGQTAGTIQDRFHGLSEGYGFIIALKYRQAKSSLTEANYQNLLNIFKTNFYELDADASHTKLKEAQAILTAAYGQLQP